MSPDEEVLESVAYDPFDPAIRPNPYPAYAALRRASAAQYCESAGLFAVSRYADVVHVLKNHELFSSDAMSLVLLGIDPAERNSPAAMQKGLAIVNALPFDVAELGQTSTLITADPPRHDVMRKIVNRGFSPRRIAPVEKRVREIADDAMSKLRDRHTFDLVSDLAVPVPVVVIAEMLGVEPERQDDFKRWSDGFIRGVTGSGRDAGLDDGGFLPTLREFGAYFKDIYERRRREPRDDLVSQLIRAEDEAGSLSASEVVLFALLLLVAGNETTTNLIGNAADALLEHPDQLERVRADRSLLEPLVEEALRWDSPVQAVFRRATRETEIGGVRIPENGIVMPILGSANRDERQWGETAAEFDIGHTTLGHVAFGFGVHFCLGSSLARLEARVALDAILDALPRVRKRDAELERVDSSLVRGPKSLVLEAV